MPLPATSFDVLAVDLRCLASRQALANEHMQVFVAINDMPVHRETLRAALSEAETAGLLSQLFRDLIPHEREFRALLTDFLKQKGLAP